MTNTEKTCFVIMPISDPDGYPVGHFSRVYEYLIRPACKAAGFSSIRGDEVKSTNYIVVDVLQRILNSDLVVCDLSGRNPNVLYELGIRQAFDLPAVLLKDRQTDRIFDIQGLRTVDYDQSLRIDAVKTDLEQLTAAIKATAQSAGTEVNSLIRLLGLQKAAVAPATEVSADTALVLGTLKDISTRLLNVEENVKPKYVVVRSSGDVVRTAPEKKPLILPNGEGAFVGDAVYSISGGTPGSLGTLVDVQPSSVVLKKQNGELYLIPPGDTLFMEMTTIPF
jgi:hypothetical protein